MSARTTRAARANKSFFDSGPGGIDLGPTLLVGTMLIGVASALYLVSRYRRATVPDLPKTTQPPTVPESLCLLLPPKSPSPVRCTPTASSRPAKRA